MNTQIKETEEEYYVRLEKEQRESDRLDHEFSILMNNTK